MCRAVVIRVESSTSPVCRARDGEGCCWVGSRCAGRDPDRDWIIKYGWAESTCWLLLGLARVLAHSIEHFVLLISQFYLKIHHISHDILTTEHFCIVSPENPKKWRRLQPQPYPWRQFLAESISSGVEPVPSMRNNSVLPAPTGSSTLPL